MRSRELSSDGRIWSNDKWTRYAFDIAGACAKMSKDPSTKCGAVIVRSNRTIAATGWNGFPRGVRDDMSLLENRPEKYPRIIHAEMNAILSAREPLDNYTLFVGPMPPCARCAGAIIQAGIKGVGFVAPDRLPEHWEHEMRITADMFHQAGVALGYYGTPESVGWPING